MVAVAAVTAVLVRAAGRPVRMIVMAALHVGIILQRSCKQSRRRFVRAAGHAAVELNPRLCQRILRACADAAADEYIYAVGCEEARQCAVAAALGIRDLLPDDPVFLHVVELELRRVAKVLEYVSVFICYRNSHTLFRPCQPSPVQAGLMKSLLFWRKSDTILTNNHSLQKKGSNNGNDIH